MHNSEQLGLLLKVQLKVPVVVRLEGTNVDQGRRILKVIFEDTIVRNFVGQCRLPNTQFPSGSFSCLQESGMTLITAEDLDDAAEKAVKALS